MANRLIREISNTDPSALEDLILVMAMNVESSLIQAGAKAGEDYSFKDLWALATPFALEIFKDKDRNISYSVSS